MRDVDGRIRSVRVRGNTKGSATRGIERALADRTDATASGAAPHMTFETLAGLWLQHRRDHGKVRSRGTLAPQTLAAYDSEIRNVIVPAIGGVQVKEANVPLLDRLFADIEHGRAHGSYPARPGGRSTRQLRVVISGMLGLAVSHGALPANPMRDVASSAREQPSEVQFLTVDDAIQLRLRVRRDSIRIPDMRQPNQDLEEFVDLLLGTGIREGEGLAIRPVDLLGLATDLPTLHVCGTLVEPRTGFVEKLHRRTRPRHGKLESSSCPAMSRSCSSDGWNSFRRQGRSHPFSPPGPGTGCRRRTCAPGFARLSGEQ